MQKTTRPRAKITVSADGRGIVSHAGGLLLTETLRVTGLGRGLSEGLSRWRAPRAVHDPGKILVDLAATLALGQGHVVSGSSLIARGAGDRVDRRTAAAEPR